MGAVRYFNLLKAKIEKKPATTTTNTKFFIANYFRQCLIFCAKCRNLRKWRTLARTLKLYFCKPKFHYYFKLENFDFNIDICSLHTMMYISGRRETSVFLSDQPTHTGVHTTGRRPKLAEWSTLYTTETEGSLRH